jgi:uncharacterized damage-inducible protein DinB
MEYKTTYRNNGAIGALLDEYERALMDLKRVLSTVTQAELVTIVDAETTDEDCHSIQTILTHVVTAGYFYAIEVRMKQGEVLIKPDKEKLSSVPAYVQALDAMFAYNVQLFEDYPNLSMDNIALERKVVFRSGQIFDYEQIFEHAIVHILRHRRQIERFLLKLRA